jgi:protein-L-isoaspartate(D-aspartate) O-methyltransferase
VGEGNPEAREARERMVREQILARGVDDPRVLAAMRALPREEFVPDGDRARAYADGPIVIGHEQTISQPYVVAAMIAALELRGTEKVLEVGAGSGYAAAVLGRVAREVWAIERIEALATAARERIARLGIPNVHVVHGDGTQGLPEHAPFDAILVSAGGPVIPPALVEQLALGGRLLMPVGSTTGDMPEQSLIRLVHTDRGIEQQRGEPVRFVPLIAG